MPKSARKDAAPRRQKSASSPRRTRTREPLRYPPSEPVLPCDDPLMGARFSARVNCKSYTTRSGKQRKRCDTQRVVVVGCASPPEDRPRARDLFVAQVGSRFNVADREIRRDLKSAGRPVGGAGRKRNHHDGYHAPGDPLGVYLPPISRWEDEGSPHGSFKWVHPDLGWIFVIWRNGLLRTGAQWEGAVTAQEDAAHAQKGRSARALLIDFRGLASREKVFEAMREWYRRQGPDAQRAAMGSHGRKANTADGPMRKFAIKERDAYGTRDTGSRVDARSADDAMALYMADERANGSVRRLGEGYYRGHYAVALGREVDPNLTKMNGVGASRKMNARPPKGTPTDTNIFALADLFTDRGQIVGRVSNQMRPTSMPHIRRCLAAGLVEVSGRELVLTPAGHRAVADYDARFPPRAGTALPHPRAPQGDPWRKPNRAPKGAAPGSTYVSRAPDPLLNQRVSGDDYAGRVHVRAVGCDGRTPSHIVGGHVLPRARVRAGVRREELRASRPPVAPARRAPIEVLPEDIEVVSVQTYAPAPYRAPLQLGPGGREEPRPRPPPFRDRFGAGGREDPRPPRPAGPRRLSPQELFEELKRKLARKPNRGRRY